MTANYRQLLILALLAGGAAFADEADNEIHVHSYLGAYNAHDVELMLEHMSDDVRWMSVSEDDIEVVSRGKSRIRQAMAGFFSAMPSGRSEAVSIQSVGDFVSVVEQAFWETPDGAGTQCALSVYEIRDELIVNVWYFSEQPCPPQDP